MYPDFRVKKKELFYKQYDKDIQILLLPVEEVRCNMPADWLWLKIILWLRPGKELYLCFFKVKAIFTYNAYELTFSYYIIKINRN